jgi:hypothetical protein
LAREIRRATASSDCSSARAISGTVSPEISRSVNASWDAGSKAGCAHVNIIRSSSSRTGCTSAESIVAKLS